MDEGGKLLKVALGPAYNVDLGLLVGDYHGMIAQRDIVAEYVDAPRPYNGWGFAQVLELGPQVAVCVPGHDAGLGVFYKCGAMVFSHGALSKAACF
jgi:hypothetical protein